MFLLFRDLNLQPGSEPAEPKQRQKKSGGHEIKKTL